MADGDVFDCVDMYKQPAFDHPRLKNHEILMKPILPLEEGLPESDEHEGVETGNKLDGEGCPPGSVPIFRSPANASGSIPSSLRMDLQDDDCNSHAWAVSRGHPFKYYGVSASLLVHAVWPVWAHQQSSSMIWVKKTGATPNQTIVIAAGWTGYPALFGDDKARVVSTWSVDGEKTICANTNCPGFVVNSPTNPLGRTSWPLSTYNGTRYRMILTIFKDSENNWWLSKGGIRDTVGYWPAEIFNGFDHMSEFEVGGYVSCSKEDQLCPKMGNGHKPTEGDPDLACYTNEIRVMRENGAWEDHLSPAQDTFASFPLCYEAGPYGYDGDIVRNRFAFGGPACPRM